MKEHDYWLHRFAVALTRVNYQYGDEAIRDLMQEFAITYGTWGECDTCNATDTFATVVRHVDDDFTVRSCAACRHATVHVAEKRAA